MKLDVVIFLLLGISVTAMSVQITYAQMSEDESDYISFESAYTGLTLKHPADWMLVEGNMDLPFIVRIWAPGNTAMISVHYQYQDVPETAEKTAELHLKQYKSDVEDFEIVESNSMVISDYPAWQLTYSGLNYQGHKFTVSDVYVTAENSQYVFSYHVWDGFPDHLHIFNSIVNTVQIISQ